MRSCMRSCSAGVIVANLLPITSHFSLRLDSSLFHSPASGVSACCCAGVSSFQVGLVSGCLAILLGVSVGAGFFPVGAVPGPWAYVTLDSSAASNVKMATGELMILRLALFQDVQLRSINYSPCCAR